MKGKEKRTQSLHSPGFRVRSLPDTWMRRLPRSSGDGEGHGDGDVVALLREQVVRRPLDLGLDDALVVDQLDHLEGEVAAALGLEEQLGGEVEGLADALGEVRRAEAGQQLAMLVGGRREGDRHVDDAHPLALFAKDAPEGIPLLAVDGDRPLLGEQPAGRDAHAAAGRDRQHDRHHGGDRRAQPEELEQQEEQQGEDRAGDQAGDPGGPGSPEEGLAALVGGGEARLVVLGVALEEVEDAMPAGVKAGREGRPGHRGLGRDRRAQRREGALRRGASQGSGACPRPSTAG